MKRFTLILSLLCFVCFGVNAQVLKVSDAPEGENWAENTTWYLIQNMKGGVVSISNTTTGGKLSLANSTTPADDDANALWCIVGNEKTGYQFYNKASGTGKVLYASRALNAGAASFNMADKTGVVNEFFDIAKSQKNGYLVVKDHDNQNNYWNDRDKNLAYWNSTGATDDDGSSFAFLDVEGFNTTVDKIDNMLKDAGVEYSARILATEETLYSNAKCYGKPANWNDNFESWSVLLDNDIKTHFHSIYGSETSEDNLDHYLRVDAGEQGTNSIIFTYTTRNIGVGECHPSHVVIEGSNSADGDYTMIKEYKSGLPNGGALKFTSEPLSWETTYRYIRFRVVSTYLNNKDGGNKAFFYLSEFGMTTVPNVSVGSEYEEYKDELTALYGVISEAKNAENIQNRTLAFNNVKYAYEAVERVLNKEYYALGDKIEELKKYIDYQGLSVGYFNISDDFLAIFYAAVAVYENAESCKDDYVDSLAALDALAVPEINLPVDGEFYLIRSAVKENGYMYAALDNNAVGDKDETNKVCWVASRTPSNMGIWECEIEDGNIYFKNVHTASYFFSTMTYYPTTLSETEKAVITFKGLGEGQVNIKVNGACIHAQDNGYVVPWDGGLNTASAWYVDKIASPVDYTLTVGAAGYATLMLGYNATIPAIDGEDCGVFVATIEGEYAVLKEIEGVLPANTAVIVKAAPENYTFEYTTETATVANNDLRGTLYNKNITEDAYVLGKDENNVAYLGLAVKTDGVWLNNANKAYLPAPENTQGVKSYSLRFEDGTTAIENVEVENEVKAIYDLTGRRVEAITAPGIYIVNGKKVLVK